MIEFETADVDEQEDDDDGDTDEQVFKFEPFWLVELVLTTVELLLSDEQLWPSIDSIRLTLPGASTSPLSTTIEDLLLAAATFDFGSFDIDCCSTGSIRCGAASCTGGCGDSHGDGNRLGWLMFALRYWLHWDWDCGCCWYCWYWDCGWWEWCWGW